MGSYKDSGIEWIGEIPKGWEVNKYKFLGSTKNGLTYTPEDITTESDGILVLRSGNIQNGQLDFNDVVFVNTSIPNNLKLQKSDILITARNGSANLVGKNILINTEINATYGAFMMVFRANRRINPRFAQYTMNPTFDNYKTFFTTSTVNQLTANIFYNMSVPLPPLQEQAAIADFLDKKNAEIDAIIAKITQQIQTLKDYRHSLITQTVTKGLDKTVAYKDSGIEWIGKIPEGWGKSDVKYLFEIISGATPESNNSEYWDGPINWITPADMNPTGPIKNGEKTITMLGYQSCGTTMIPENSIIISNRAPIGKINYNQTELCTSQGCKGLVNIKKNNLLYFYYFFIAFTNQLKLLGRGTTFLELSTKDLGNFSLIVPPLQEQAAIADFLDDKTAKINRIIAKKEQQLEIIKEHRKSLIYEYVTGKKRVKEYHEDGN